MTEIEIRGKITKEKFNEVMALMNKDASLKDCYKRLSVDISPGFNEVDRSWQNVSGVDLRIKKSGSKEKISAKMGNFNDKEREELDIKLEEGQILETIKMFVRLGLGKGMIYQWESWEFDFEDFEVKLSKYTDDYYTFEIESGTGKNDPDDLTKKLGLVPYSDEEYKEAIVWENRNIHQLFSIEAVEKILNNWEK
ncbi:MAG: hypothetical protein US68_C0006G0089 [Candidatus Shapirobacteria bacterium GW2011_GWE1_38_10]|uniref:CYTH domain-containing protein n=1 Tax=Candidatus Shapirobacteria bacterium GW2011_GWE1_38_10 TaxID=1618488 RepID=A0A0G0KMI3_9BACT|nr:MAG: hypothetical protein US46_C0002G0090 [Candidatus Shapirobacteria bacterium GW2011_GWF2_37_20]KKQ50409.1 MAG: hypothetical protein US68_C0006G0089 [Candidatus Shapirobacteria bacterium GW2011_GWE1_38_10]KKQ65233.1 MAG: hypothetical protein US85_C0001G0160 [Candidatus Shapirobacteria bacterium GW2011_GWF1_38_23]HBP51191.1 hypothetical protein [Candidatus Shapirobacteria bacterium]